MVNYERELNLRRVRSVLEAVDRERRRTRMDIIAKILSVALTDKPKSHIRFRVSMNYKQTEEYFNFLINAGLLRKEGSSERALYKTTNKGVEVIVKYIALKELIEDAYASIELPMCVKVREF